jgi:hypothetical protein
MFIFIDEDLVNINHIVNCHPRGEIIMITLDTGKTYNIGLERFTNEILSCLPMSKKPKKKEGE